MKLGTRKKETRLRHSLAQHVPCESLVDTMLLQSVEACQLWHSLYQAAAEEVATDSARKWDFNTTSFFARLDAFLQRCQ